MQRTNLWLIVLVMALGLVGCGVAQSATLTPNPDEETVLIYTALRKEFNEQYVAAFRIEHPDVKINIVTDSTGKITQKLLSEKGDPQVDVVWALPTTSLLQAASEDMLEPYAPAGLAQVNLKMRDASDPPLFVGLYVYMSAFCVNTAELQKKGLPIPTSWADLINPVYKDQIVMPDPSSSGTGYMALASFFYRLQDEQRAWDYMNELDKNIALYTKSGSQPCKLASDGKVPIGIGFFDADTSKKKAEGFPIEPVFPKEGSGWEMDSSALIRKNIIKPGAKLFLDWAISDDAMRQYAYLFPITSVPTNQPILAGYPAEPLKQLIPNWRFFWVASNRDRITSDWVNRYGAKSEGQGAEVPDALR